MTFELSADQQAARDKARAFATERLTPHAAEIDRTSATPAEIAREAVGIVEGCADAVATITALEEIAAASGTVAVVAAAGSNHTAPAGLAGLRGATLPQDSPPAHLALAAVALGLGRAALEQALSEIRRTDATPQQGSEKPHWVIADAATELEAARLMTRAAAQALDRGDAHSDVAIARLMASAAARVSVDAALRVAGAAGYGEGTLLERLARDVRAICVLMGTEEQHRAIAAEGLLPG